MRLLWVLDGVEIVATIQTMEKSHFYKSMTSHADMKFSDRQLNVLKARSEGLLQPLGGGAGGQGLLEDRHRLRPALGGQEHAGLLRVRRLDDVRAKLSVSLADFRRALGGGEQRAGEGKEENDFVSWKQLKYCCYCCQIVFLK